MPQFQKKTKPAGDDSPVEVLSEAAPLSDEQELVAEPRTFYSRAASLVISATKGQRVVIDGEYQRVDELIICFNPQANNIGVYTTSKKKEIAYLEERVKRVGDVMLPEEYNKLITPADERIKQLESENTRILEDRNRLLAMLHEKDRQEAAAAQ